eukprot:PhF_6_TR1153/c0_g1_i1/m.2325
MAAATAVRSTIEQVKSVIAANETVYIPFWCRHHWTLMRVSGGIAELFDSAPSEAVHRDARRFAADLGVRCVICPCPQQFRGSVECGVFVVGFLLCLTNGVKMRLGKVSLQAVRQKLSVTRCPQLEWFSDMFETALLRGGSRNWVAV